MNSRNRLQFPFLFFALVIAILVLTPGRPVVAQTSAQNGMIMGAVTADHGEVRGFRVKARDTELRITYTVFTQGGRYQIYNLLPGKYEVRVLQEGFDSPVQAIELKPGGTETVDIQLTAEDTKSDKAVPLVDYDTLYPPGPGRDALLRECSGCHGRLSDKSWHGLRLPEQGWRAMVDIMTSPQSPLLMGGVQPIVDLAPGDKEIIIQYFTEHFGPDNPPQGLKIDPLVLDEEALSEVLYIEYDMPSVQGTFENGAKPSRHNHDLHVSADGTIWGAGFGSSSIVHLDQHNPDFLDRFTEYPITNHPSNTRPHGVVEDEQGRIFWTELDGRHIGVLEPKTGEMTRYAAPSPGALHTLRLDSRGRVWYSAIHGSKLGMLDITTGKIKDWDSPIPDSALYGVIVDKQDRVWVTGLRRHVIYMFDPETEEFTTYPTPTQPSGPRRLTFDSKGKIWFSEYSGNQLGVLDPDTGEMEEYKMPLSYTTPYACWADKEDNIWQSDIIYNSMVKFDQKTRKFTYVPFPQLLSHTPKIEVDEEGTLWYAPSSRNPANAHDDTIVALKFRGNVPL